MKPSFITPLLLAVALAVASCGGAPEGGLVDVTLTSDLARPQDAGTPSPKACGPQALCARTVNECKANLTQVQCEGWYAKPSHCRDMSAYTACNCGCIGESTCSDYFACGNLCFNDHCK